MAAVMEADIALKPDVLEQLAEQSRREGRSVNDLIDEAVRVLLRNRRDVADLRAFVAENEDDARRRGLSESDVARLVAESRAEQRRR